MPSPTRTRATAVAECPLLRPTARGGAFSCDVRLARPVQRSSRVVMRALVAISLVAACWQPVLALTLFTEAKRGDFRPASAVVRVGADRALQELRPPTCPATSSLRFALSRHGNDFEDHGEIPLPCDFWVAVK